MGLCSDFYEELVHKQQQRIKLLEEVLKEIKEIADLKSFPDGWSYQSELLDINRKINQIPDLK